MAYVIEKSEEERERIIKKYTDLGQIKEVTRRYTQGGYSVGNHIHPVEYCAEVKTN